MTHVEFLTARYDELELRIKAAAQAGSLTTGRRGGKTAIVDYVNALGLSPDYLLADLAAKRAIIESYEHATKNWPEYSVLETVLLLLVQPFASHPDYDPSSPW